MKNLKIITLTALAAMTLSACGGGDAKGDAKGNAWAKYFLGECSFFGLGVPQNYEEAVKLFKEASELGNVDAMNRLGVCYARGQGIAQDHALAVNCFTRAVKRSIFSERSDSLSKASEFLSISIEVSAARSLRASIS